MLSFMLITITSRSLVFDLFLWNKCFRLLVDNNVEIHANTTGMFSLKMWFECKSRLNKLLLRLWYTSRPSLSLFFHLYVALPDSQMIHTYTGVLMAHLSELLWIMFAYIKTQPLYWNFGKLLTDQQIGFQQVVEYLDVPWGPWQWLTMWWQTEPQEALLPQLP